MINNYSLVNNCGSSLVHVWFILSSWKIIILMPAFLLYQNCNVKNKISLFIIILFIAFFSSGCNKFDEGVNYSLRSETNRLTNTWKYISVYDFEAGELQTSGFNGWSEKLNNNGDYEKTIVYFGDETIYAGKWIYDEEKTLQLTYTMHEIEIVEVYTIVRLSKDELTLRNDKMEIHFQKK